MSIKRGIYRRASAVTALVFALAITAPAFGDPVPTDGTAGGSQSSDMTVIGFDQAIAEKNGYEVQAAENGARFVVPATNDPGDLTGGTEMSGDC